MKLNTIIDNSDTKTTDLKLMFNLVCVIYFWERSGNGSDYVIVKGDPSYIHVVSRITRTGIYGEFNVMQYLHWTHLAL